MRRFRSVAMMMAIAALTSPAAAQQSPDSGARLVWRTSIKVSALVSRAPDAPLLFPDRTGAESRWRFRTEPVLQLGKRATLSTAYEQRVRWGADGQLLAPGAVLRAVSAAPFRVTPLDWRIVGSTADAWEHEIDRLNLRVRVPRAELTLGRQAIGWGRGVMFGAVDLFAPFSPLEADREWRRGVDAARADIRLTDRSSLDLVAAFGRSWDASAIAGRWRAYTRAVDVELMAGRRARDAFGGVTSSAPIGEAAVHGELAVFATPSDESANGGGPVWKAVAGGSYRFPIGSGLLTYAEYHFSGFGAARPQEIVPLLSTPAFVERYLRGDTQILSKHALAVTGSYEQSPDWAWSGQWVFNPADGSGIVSPGFTFTVRDNVSFDGQAYFPYGRPPVGFQLRSEYGTAPLAAFLQLRVYF